MKILVTGANGFVGRNLCAQLNNIKNGRTSCYNLQEVIEDVFEYDIYSTELELERFCQEADYVFNLAGVNRPNAPSEFEPGNVGFTIKLLNCLKKYGNACPVMLSSSQYASLVGRFADSEYGRSKKAAEDLCLKYQDDTGAKVQIYRFPNLFGKWCRPNYNSAVATFCHNIAHGMPIQVNDTSVEIELLYIDDLIDEMIEAVAGREHRCEFNGLEVFDNPEGRYCYVPTTYKTTIGEIVDILYSFTELPDAMAIPCLPDGSLKKKLYSTYLSFLPKEKMAFPLKMNKDDRGNFTELIHFLNCGQVSINISKPGITKGEHWHNSKCELFFVVSGHGLIKERKIGTDEVIEFEVSGDNIQCIYMLPGYTHNITNLSETENLVTVMYSNDKYNPSRPDTFFEIV